MDVRMPDGTIVTNVPDGTTQEELVRRLTTAEDPGALGSAFIGAGRVFDRMAKGAEQAVRGVAGTVASSLPYQGARDFAASQDRRIAEMAQEEKANTQIYDKLAKAHPVATFAGEAAPMIAGLPVAGSVGGAAAISALPGMMEYGTPEERMQRAAMGAVGGAAGAGLGKLAGRVVQPIRNEPTLTQQAAQQAADRIGLNLRADEVAGSRPLNWFASALNDMPFSGGMAQKAETARRQAINSAAAKEIGQTANELTDQVLASARNDIGSAFDNLLSGRQIVLDGTFRNEVKNVIPSKVMKSLRDEGVESIVRPFQNMPNGTVKVTGEWFQQNKTALDSAIRSAYTAGESGKARALESFEDALVGAATRSMGPADAAAYKAAQKQWANLRLLETGKVVEGGNVMPGRLDSALTTRYKAAYKEGKLTGALPDIGKIAQTYKPMPQSGTTPRMIYSSLAGAGAFANPMLTAGMFTLPPIAQAVLQSKAGGKYLTDGLMKITPEIDKRLSQAGYGLLSAPLLAGMD